MSDFEAYFRAFLGGVLGVAEPATFAPARFDPSLEDEWRIRTSKIAEWISPSLNENALTRSIVKWADRIDAATLPDVVAQKLEIAPASIYQPNGEDFYYFKINHGFWECVYWVFAPTFDPVRMRTNKFEHVREDYVRSGFIQALMTLVRRAARDDGDTIRFDNLRFGVNLISGARPQAEIMSLYPGSSETNQRVAMGATIGLLSSFEAMFGEKRLIFVDGSFPKDGLNTGALRKTLAEFSRVSDEIVYVVPPHLSGVALAGAASPQSEILISGTLIHQTWAPSLFNVGREIFARLERAQSLLVVTQSAVFSAMLALFLKEAKAVLAPDKRIYYFDLGQALDIANPEGGGPFLKNLDVLDRELFHIAPR